MAIEAARTTRIAPATARLRTGWRWRQAIGKAFRGRLINRAGLRRDAFDAAPGGQLIIAPDGGAVDANAAFHRLFEAAAGPPLDYIEQAAADPSSAVALRRLRAAAAAGGHATAEIILRGPDVAASRHVRISVGPIAGHPGYSLWNVEDFATERIEIGAILAALELGWFSVDGEGRFQFVNLTMANWLGAMPAELVAGGRLQDYLPSRDPSGAPPFATGATGSGEVAFVTRHGNRFDAWIEHRTIPQGEDRRIHGIVRNLSQEQEAAARAPREWFHRFFAQAPVGVALVDRSGQFVEANQAVGALFDRVPQELLGTKLTSLIGELDRADVTAMLAAGEAVRREPIEVRLDGPHDRTLVLFLGRLDTAGESEAVSAIHFIDVTERKNLEQQFAQSQKMQAVGQLAGGIAHDFNNLLTAMIGFCDLLLLRCRPGDPSFADIMQIQQNASRAANLVRQLLAFSRQQALQPRILDVTDMLVELSHLLRRLIGENIEFELVHGRDLGLTKVDQGQFEQVIINLAVNARDAMPGGGRLTIRTNGAIHAEPQRHGHETLPAGEYVLVEVADTGVGIPAANLERIFEPFFSTKAGGSSTGLGLSTVYGIVRQTGGFVFVDSAPGRGTTFQIYLPRCAATELPAGRADVAEPAAVKDLTGSGRIMLVEDDDPVRIFGARALRNKGYTVLEAKSGEMALELLRSGAGNIDLLITDVVMPNIDGPRLAREVRELEPLIKVIFISGYAEDAFRQRLGNDSDIHFLAKPFSLKQLAMKVREVLKTRRPNVEDQLAADPRAGDTVRPR
jgi:two-component system, cell cycle sensor histidine kinase and response regulator CckA